MAAYPMNPNPILNLSHHKHWAKQPSYRDSKGKKYKRLLGLKMHTVLYGSCLNHEILQKKKPEN